MRILYNNDYNNVINYWISQRFGTMEREASRVPRSRAGQRGSLGTFSKAIPLSIPLIANRIVVPSRITVTISCSWIGSVYALL